MSHSLFLLLIYVSEYTRLCLFSARFYDRVTRFELKIQSMIKTSSLPMQTIYI